MNIRELNATPEQERVVETALARLLRQQREKSFKEATLPVYEPPKKVAEWIPIDESTDAYDYDSEDENLTDKEIIAELEDDYEEDSLAGTAADSSDAYRSGADVANWLGIPTEADSRLVDPNIILDESQVAAIQNLMGRQYGILTGAAGTGKTTVTKALVKELIYNPESGFKAKRINGLLNIAFCAFTGMAVQVIKENLPAWLHQNCMTIHSLLEFRPQESIRIDKETGQTKVTMPFLPSRNELNLLDYDMVIFDEASMLGLDLWNQFRIACKPGTRIIFIGDLNQLPPIIGESIFAYALGSWVVSELTHVHRQTGNAGKIVEIAHEVLNGRYFAEKLIPGKKPPENIDKSASKLDPMGLNMQTLTTNDTWRVAGSMLPARIKEASPTLLKGLNMLRNVTFPDGTRVYDPFRDRVMTAGNGYDEMKESAMMQQYPINEALAVMIQPPTDEHPRFIIDGGRVTRHFAIGNRVMATRNESPAKVDRVTNGMTGVIIDILPNSEYTGQKNRFGPEQNVRAYIERQFQLLEGNRFDEAAQTLDRGKQLDAAHFAMDSISMDDLANDLANRIADADTDEALNKADSSTWSSHTVIVKFVNGAVREFWAKTGIESLQLAYASTVAKCQGSQFPTAIIVVHEAQKEQMSREWLYTAITRAQGHVILLYTEFALRFCLSKQKIVGRTMAEKIQRYQEMLAGTGGPMAGLMRKNVILEVGE